MVDITASDEVSVQVPQKQSVIGGAADDALKIGVATTALGSLFNVSKQRLGAVRAFKNAHKGPEFKAAIEEFIKKDITTEFSNASHSKWVEGAMIAGLAAGATLGALAAENHNRQVDNFRQRLEAEEAAKALAAAQAQGPAKG
jgi:hypothetical protein